MILQLLRQYRLALTGLAGVTVVSFSGCSACCGPFDYHYPAYPGIVQRADPEYGRVGSIFSDPYKAGTGPSADSNLKTVQRKESTPVDELEEIPEAMPGPELEKPQDPPREPMNIDRQTRSLRPPQNSFPTQWR